MDGTEDTEAGDPFTQDRRLIGVDTVLGPDVLLLTEFIAEEGISELFSARVTMLSTNPAIKPESLVGTKITVWLANSDEQRTPFSGYIRRLRVGLMVRNELREYEADVVPWLWFLTRTSDCRIFQNMSVPDVIKQVFNDLGFKDHDFNGLMDSYPPLDYIVQYRESAFDFVCRWMEELGIFYYFRHEAGKHTMVLADHNVSFKPAPEGSVGYSERGSPEIARWQHAYDYCAGSWTQQDFNFETPSVDLLTQQRSVLKLPNIGNFERFDYPGRYETVARGTSLTRVRIEDEEARFHSVEGESSCSSFRSGLKFTFEMHDLSEEKGISYVLSRVVHRAREPSHMTTPDSAGTYENSFVAVPATVRFRPPRMTQRPVVQGPQTATVVGPAGETIYTDKYGRVKLQFHWDRRGHKDDKSSCWVRVAQPWGGGGWGGMFVPHVGHEVVVSFLEGDPDRPLVTGRVYNAEKMQAIGLPANKTQSAWRDHTGNEILMEGKGGSQDIRVTAVKDMNVTVQRDHNDIVRTGNRTIQVSTGTHTETIKGDTKITVTTGALTIVVAANAATIQSKSTTTVSSTNADVYLQAKTQIALDVGNSHLLMKDDGTIKLDGKNVVIHGSESVSIQGNAIRSIADQEHETKGAITVSEGVTTNTVKGGMVMLNPGS